MNRLRSFLWISLALCAPSLARADGAWLKVCNKGPVEIDVAVASRIQNFLVGYHWETAGWYEVSPGECPVVYSEDYEEEGTFTPQSGALLAFTTTNHEGYWGAFGNDELLDARGWIHESIDSICVKYRDVFHTTRPEGDPAAKCDGTRIPAAYEFDPPEPGEYTLNTAWDGEQSLFPYHVKDAVSGRLIYGDEVRYSDKQWSFANGAPVPNSLIDKASGLPPLLPKWQLATSDDLVAGDIKGLKDTASSISCKDFDTSGQVSLQVSSVQFTMDDFGVVIFSYVVKWAALAERTESYGAVLGSLDLSNITTSKNRDGNDCTFVLLNCKYGLSCVRAYNNSAVSALAFYVDSRAQLDEIEGDLGILQTYYPQNLGEIH